MIAIATREFLPVWSLLTIFWDGVNFSAGKVNTRGPAVVGLVSGEDHVVPHLSVSWLLFARDPLAMLTL